MSLVTIIWSMIASACLTLAGIHFLLWCRSRTAWTNLLFCCRAALNCRNCSQDDELLQLNPGILESQCT
jgi:hypothetical protein